MSVFYSELDAVLQVATPVLSRGEGLIRLANTLSNEDQDTIGFLCSKGLLLSHIQFDVHQDPLDIFCQATFQLGGCPHILVLRLVHEVCG